MNTLLKRLCYGLILVYSFSLGAQNQQEHLRNDFEGYMQTLVQKDFTSSIKYMMEEIFTIVSKEQMIELLKEAYGNPEMTFNIRDTEIDRIETFGEIDGRHYALVYYRSTCEISIHDEELKEMAEMGRDVMIAALEVSFGQDTVSYDEQHDHYIINISDTACAVSSDGVQGWTFAVMDPDQMDFLKTFIPNSVFSKAFQTPE